MKAAPFEYAVPSSIDEALALVADGGEEARFLAGGQSLVPLMAFRLAEPTMLVDLNRIPALREVVIEEGGALVGAMVTQAAAGGAEEIHPLVRQALPLIGHQQIRNRGTIGGSLAHADPAAELPAVAVALGAEMIVKGSSGSRRVVAADFFVTHFATAMGPDEVLEGVWFPNRQPQDGSAILEVGRRPGDFALAGVAARLRLGDGDTITDAAVVPFAVGDRPVASVPAREGLIGSSPGERLFREVAGEVAANVHPTSDVHATAEYRRHAVRVLAARALAQASRLSRGGP